MYIIAGLFNIISTHFSYLNINLDKIFTEFKTDIGILKTPMAKIDSNILGRYIEQVVLITKNSRIGVETGFLIPFMLTGNIFNIYHEFDTILEIFDHLDMEDPTANNITKYNTRIKNDLFYYEFSIAQGFIDKHPIAAKFWNDLLYGVSLQYAYSFTGRILYPLFVSTTYGKEGDIDRLEDYLSCPVKFKQKKSALVYNASILTLPVVTAKKELYPIFENIMGEIQNTKHNTLSSSIRRFLTHSLSTSDLDLETVAEKFNMSKRNIQRKLKQEGASYQQILDNLRMELSLKYLKEKTPLVEISDLLGFESQSAFNKFFRKHFHSTPGKFGHNT
jgi:AraC-like DNA-binding protein